MAAIADYDYWVVAREAADVRETQLLLRVVSWVWDCLCYQTYEGNHCC